MARTANLNIRIDPATKEDAEKLFSTFGITITDAVNMFLHAIFTYWRFSIPAQNPTV